MKEQHETNSSKQNIILEQRKDLRISGVKDIDSFSETKIVLNTVAGELVIKGNDLHIISLITETGDFTLKGRINSLVYNDFSSNANFFKRVFR